MMKISRSSCLVGLVVFSIFGNLALWIFISASDFIQKLRNRETQADGPSVYRQRQYMTRNAKARRPPKYTKYKVQTIKGALYHYHPILVGHKRSAARSTNHATGDPHLAAAIVSLHGAKLGVRVEKASKHNMLGEKAARLRLNLRLKRSSKKRKDLSSFIPKVVCGNTSDFTDIDRSDSAVPKIDLFIAIITAPHRLSRRAAIRQTWLSTENLNPSVAYRFFTDGKGLSSEMETNLLKERKGFKDLEFLPTKGGYWFSHRILHALFWAYKRFDFKFFLRMDDDYFVCLNSLVANLQHRKDDKFLYWGWMHCVPKQTRMDEGFLILGVDLVREIIQRNKSLCCHPFGDQMVAMWVNRLEQEGVKVTYFVDNDRVIHRRKHLKEVTSDLCKNIIGIHQTYPELMVEYWNISKRYKPLPGSYKNVGITKYGDYCKFPRGLDWRSFLRTFWGHEPKSCWDRGVVWLELVGQMFHVGRDKN